MGDAPHLEERFIHLGLGATAVPQPSFEGLAWYEGYAARHGSDGADGRLVSMYRFDQDWDSWEMHPADSEVVICVAGSLTLIREFPDGLVDRTTLDAGAYAINPPGVWHTADIDGSATAIFITAGEGTQHRPRQA